MLVLAGCGGGESGGATSPAPPPASSAPPAAPGQFVVLQLQTYELFKYDLDSDALTSLSPPLAAPRSASQPVMSPDGKWVAYTSNQDDQGRIDLYVAATDGSGVTKLNRALPAESAVFEFPWSPDSSQIAYRTSLGIYLVNRDGTNHRKVSAEVGDPATADVPIDIRWSPNGRYVAYEVHASPNFTGIAIDVHDVQAGVPNRVRITPVPSPLLAGIGQYEWAPDSSRIAYQAYADGIMELYTVRPDSTDNIKVNAALVANGRVLTFDWSPDGSRIAYVADQDVYSVRELYTVAPDGSGGVKINEPLSAANAGVQFVHWAPDSSRIAYTAYTGTTSVFYTARPDGNDRIKINAPLVTNDEFVTGLGWSPDSSRIAYQIDRGTYRDLYVVRPDGSGSFKVNGTFTEQVAPYCGRGCPLPYSTYFLWSPDGSQLAYLADQATPSVELFAVRPDTGEYFKLNHTLPAGDSMRYVRYAWSNDGSRVAYGDAYMAASNGAANKHVSSSIPSGSNAVHHFIWSR